MKTVRHEEYVRFEDDLPFYFQPNIVRTPKLCSTSQNWHENIELQICLCGRGEVLLDGEKYPFEEGDVIVVPPNVIHYTIRRSDTPVLSRTTTFAKASVSTCETLISRRG